MLRVHTLEHSIVVRYTKSGTQVGIRVYQANYCEVDPMSSIVVCPTRQGDFWVVESHNSNKLM